MDELIKYTNYSKLKYNVKIKYFLYVSISILIILCVMIHNISMPYYYYNKGIINEKDGNKYLKLLISEKDMNRIQDNNMIIINNKKYKYHISYISDLITDSNYNNYFEVYLKGEFNREIENSIHEVKIEYSNRKLNKIIYDFVVGR